MTKQKKNHLQVPSDLDALAEVLSWFDGLLHGTIDQETWIECKTALTEAWTNAVRHGNKGLPRETPIDMEVTICPEVIEIRIWDRGPGFDLERKLQEQRKWIDLNREIATGGRGLLLIEKISDLLSYTRTADNRNCLLIIKNCQRYQKLTEADCR